MKTIGMLIVGVVVVGLTVAARADTPVAAKDGAPAPLALKVKVKSVRTGYVKLRVKGDGSAGAAAAGEAAPAADKEAKKDGGDGDDLFQGLNQDLPKTDEAKSPQPLLIVDVEFTNVSDHDVVYHTYNGTDEQCQHFASLKDDAKHFFALASFGDGQEVVGAVKGSKTIKAGKTITDRLVYEVPPATVKALKLVLPAANVGGDPKANATLDVPMDGVKLAGK